MSCTGVLASDYSGVHLGRVVAAGVTNDGTGTEDIVIIAEMDLAKRDLMNSDFENSPEADRISGEIRMRVMRC